MRPVFVLPGDGFGEAWQYSSVWESKNGSNLSLDKAVRLRVEAHDVGGPSDVRTGLFL